jgi:NAD+ diphosphatase
LAGAEAAFWFAFRSEELLLLEGEPPSVPRRSPEELGLRVLFEQEVGELDGRRCYAVEVAPDAEAPEGMAFQDLRGLWDSDEAFFSVAGRAKQIVEWNRTHRFCGRCGTETEFGSEPLAKKCPRCGMAFYPRLSPAAIMLVRRDDELLLARSPHFPPGMYSALAGFVEPGESIEETIRREVREEVGVELGNIRYFGSQPWPFPNSLMIGFIVDYAGGELKIGQPEEIEDAGWYSLDRLPKLPPGVSIARAMIDQFVAEHDGYPQTSGKS